MRYQHSPTLVACPCRWSCEKIHSLGQRNNHHCRKWAQGVNQHHSMFLEGYQHIVGYTTNQPIFHIAVVVIVHVAISISIVLKQRSIMWDTERAGLTVMARAPHSLTNRGMSLCALGWFLPTPVLYPISSVTILHHPGLIRSLRISP